MTVWVRRVEDEFFEYILGGLKTIEARAPKSDSDESYSQMEEGDILKLKPDKYEPACFEIEEDPRHYDSTEEMLEKEDWGYVVPKAEDMDDALDEFDELPRNYPTRIEEYGVFAIELGDEVECLL